MKNPMISASVSRPTAIIPSKQESFSKFSEKPAKFSPNFSKNPNHRTPDAHLNYLCKNGRLRETIKALDSISETGSKVESDTFINLIQSCIDSGSLDLGRQLHARIHLVEEKDPFLETKLVSMYAKIGSLRDARKVFDEMRERNLYTWSAMIGACSRKSRWREVVELFFLMMGDGIVPDHFLFPKILEACGNCGDVLAGNLIHSLAIRMGLVSNARVINSILSVYAKCGRLGLARKLFEVMGDRDMVAWNSLIVGYCQKGDYEEAHRLFNTMREEGVEPGLVSWNILISSYNQVGQCDVAMGLMKEMESYGITPDVFTWTAMISGLAQNGRVDHALDLFREMILAGVKPNGITIASAISACTSNRGLRMGMEIHSVVVKMGIVDEVPVGNSLLGMYSRYKEMEAARKVFDGIQEKDVYSWNSMIGGFAQAGYCGKANEIFLEMQESDVKPNAVTWNSMISGYMQNGDEEEAMHLFQMMEKYWKVRPNEATWNSLIAGYVQLGDKDKAFGIFRQMQSNSFRPNSVTILSVLPACANLIAAKKVKEIHCLVLRRQLNSLPVSNALIDTYAKSGNMDYARTIFDRMPTLDIITWNSILGGYVLHGCPDAAFCIADQMRELGIKPNRSTFTSIIRAHGFAGMVNEGNEVFTSITDNYGIMVAVEHYSAMIELYGRSGRLGEAMEFIEGMPMEPDSSVWTSLLTASRNHGNTGLAILAAEQLLGFEPGNILIQRLLLQMYDLYGKSVDPSKTRKLEDQNILNRPLGQSWIEVGNTVQLFATGDRSNPRSDDLYSWVQNTAQEAKISDYHDEFAIEEEAKEGIAGVHSEKLAIAFALIGSHSVPRSIRIVKNMRMCGNCHRFAKYISMKYGCQIYLSDTKSFHHFKDGHCSCGDYW